MSDGVAADLRLAWRRLARSPAFTLAAAITLALGIGANTAIFTLVDAALLRPLPYPEADRLGVLWESKGAAGQDQEGVSATNFLDWQRETRAFEELAAWTSWGFAVTGSGEPEELNVVRASPGIFRLLGVAPVLGRGFLDEEATPGRDRVVVLSHGLWSQRFGGDPGTIGTTVVLDGAPYEIIGVMPAGFRFPNDAGVDLWVSLGFDEGELTTRAERMFQVIGRLAPGMSFDEARAELELIAGGLAKEFPETNGGWTINLQPASEAAGARSRRPLAILLGTAGFVLLIACANVGHLVLARAVDREREIAVRTALGASPGRVARMLVLESALVALLGTLLGLALAAWAVPAIRTLDPGLLPGWRTPAVDGRVLLFASGLLVLTTLVSSLWPALQSASPDLQSPLAGAGGRLTDGRRRARLRQGLIVGEVALSVVLLVAAGLMLRSLQRLNRVDPGFDPDRVLAMTLFPAGEEYRDRSRQAAFFAELVERLSRMPGVEAAGAVTTLPMNPIGIDYDLPFSADGRPPAPTAERQEVDFRGVQGDYFRALGIPVLRGRGFTSADRADGARVVIVNETLVRRHFAGGDPVGREVWVGGSVGQATVVGVVGDTRHRGLATAPRPELYVPTAQYPQPGMTVALRARGEPLAIANAAKAQVYAIAPSQPISDLVTLPELLSDSVSPRRFNLILLASFAGLALVLAAIGVYGILAYSVTQRTREIGVRLALGAGSAEIRRAVSWPGLGLASVGVLLGLGGAWALTRVLSGELYEVSPRDPATFGAVAALLLAVAWAATEIPARRAVRVDPVIALRSE